MGVLLPKVNFETNKEAQGLAQSHRMAGGGHFVGLPSLCRRSHDCAAGARVTQHHLMLLTAAGVSPSPFLGQKRQPGCQRCPRS